jgi:hypothetical protein
MVAEAREQGVEPTWFAVVDAHFVKARLVVGILGLRFICVGNCGHKKEKQGQF